MSDFPNPTEPSPSIRQKIDPAWAYATEEKSSDGKRYLICLFCNRKIRGGGISRMKMHLAGKRGDVGPCKKTPGDVRHRMLENLKEFSEARNESQKNFETTQPNIHDFRTVETGDSSNNPSVGAKKRKGSGLLKSYFPKGTGKGSQPTIKAALQSKERWHQADMAVGKFFYDNCIPMNAANSIYYQEMIDAVASMGLGYKGPSYQSLRVNLLRDAKKEVQLLVDSYRSTWAETGCTIMGDGWKDVRQRSLINFLVYSSKGICFIKSVDASDIVSDAQTLCNLFVEIVDVVGHANVVHMVTDNASNYKAAGRLLNEKYPTISWSPCAAHCLNLILKDIAKMSNVESLTLLASTITVFIYNHKWTLAWLRKQDNWTEILRPGETRFATTFIALKSIFDHKSYLQAMITSQDFNSWSGSKTQKGKEVSEIVLSTTFWKECLVIIKVVGPLVRLLRLVDSDERPVLGYVYEGMYRARKGIKNIFRGNKRLYKPYVDIIKPRWDVQMRRDIHVAAYWLNPAFQYDQANFSKKPEVMAGLMNVLSTKIIGSSTKAVEEIRLFRDQLKSFGSNLALASCKSTQPGMLCIYFINCIQFI